MNKSGISLFARLAILISCCLAVQLGCGGRQHAWAADQDKPADAKPADTKQADTKSPIKIGAVLPFSGGVELYGNQAKMGIDLAAQEINAGGGILGRPVQILYEDDHTRPEHAGPAITKLIDQEHVLAVIGPITSQNLGALLPIAEAKKTPLLYATNYEGGKSGRYFFSLSTVPNQDLAPLFPYMKKAYGEKFFLLGLDKIWPHLMFDIAEPMINSAGGNVVGKSYITGEETDYTPIVKQIAEKKPNVIVIAMKGEGMGFIPAAEKQGLLKQAKIAFLGLSEPDLKSFEGKAQDMLVVVPFVQTSKSPEAQKFVAAIRKNAGADAIVSNYAMTHYNALMAIKQALEKSGKADDKEALVDSLVGVSIKTPAGHLKIEANHHSTMNVFLAKTKGSDLVVVEELGEIGPEPAGAKPEAKKEAQ